MFIEKKHIFLLFSVLSIAIWLLYITFLYNNSDDFYNYTLDLVHNPLAMFFVTEYILLMIATMLIILIEGQYLLKNNTSLMIFLCMFCTPAVPLFIFLYIRHNNID